jgi:SAM-dependent methyltransferase
LLTGLTDLLRPGFRWLVAFGLDLPDTVRNFHRRLRAVPATLRDYRLLKEQNRADPLFQDIRLDYPCLQDRYQPAGLAAGPYFHFDLLVAREIHERNPDKHVDVGSRIDGFVAHVASFREIEVFDIRPVDARIPNVVFRQCDFMNPDAELKDYCDSLSCLHTLEHFGLGRYGDPVNIRGHVDGFRAFVDILKPGGILYLSVPIGRERIEFNGHRVFAVETILGLAAGQLELFRFSCVGEDGTLHENVPVNAFDHAARRPPAYNFGLFEFRKPGSR